MTSCVHFPGLSQLHGRESWVGITVCLLALQDGEVTIITQTIEDTMFLSKLRRFIRVVWFKMLKVSIEQKPKSSCENLRNYNRNNFAIEQLSKVKGNASIDKFLKQDKLELRIYELKRRINFCRRWGLNLRPPDSSDRIRVGCSR